MRKKFININEEINRIKSLFTEERVFGNLVEQDEKKTGCIQGNCQDGQGTLKDEDGRTYTGEFKDGKFNGKGTWEHKNGDKYEGQFLNGKYHGEGTYYYKEDNEKYEGTWSNGNIFNGEGVYHVLDSDGNLIEYVGKFKNGKLNDEQGVIRYDVNGKKYFGNFENGVFKHGTEFHYGTRLYTGGFLNGKYHGKGTSFDENGKIRYEGTWENGKKNGEGTLYENGKTYKVKHKYGEEIGREKITNSKKTNSRDKSSEEEGSKSSLGKSSEEGSESSVDKSSEEGSESNEKEDNVLEVRERKCNNRIDKYLRRFEKNPSFLGDITKNKGEDNSEYKIIEYCITNFGDNYTGNQNLNRFLDKLGIPKPEEKINTEKNSFNIIIDGKKVATLKRLKTYEYKLYGEENFRMIQNGSFINDKLKQKVFEVLKTIETGETIESLNKKVEIIDNNYKYPQTITFKINP